MSRKREVARLESNLNRGDGGDSNVKLSKIALVACAAALGVLTARPADAAIVNITANITPASPASLMHWTADNEYILGTVIYVEAGVTLTIEPGTVVRGLPDSATPGVQDPGTLVITRGAKIFAMGTKLKPIIFTNEDDDNFGSNPGTDPYDVAANARGITGTWG